MNNPVERQLNFSGYWVNLTDTSEQSKTGYKQTFQEPKKEYYEGKMNEPETKSNKKNCRDGGINEFKKDYETVTSYER